MRLLASALVLALLGMGSFWLWQEATSPDDVPRAGVVATAGVQPGAEQATPPGASGASPATVPETVAGTVPTVADSAAVRELVASVAKLADEVWAGMTLEIGKGAQDHPAQPSTEQPAPSKPSSEPVYRAPVDPDGDDDDDDDDDDDWDDDDDDDDDWDDD